MDRTEAIHRLRGRSLLGSAPPAVRAILEKELELVDVGVGEEVVSQGAAASHLVIPLDTSLELSFETQDGRRRFVGSLRPRRSLNLGALLHLGAWQYSATAIGAGTVARVPARKFLVALQRAPAYRTYLTRMTTSRGCRALVRRMRSLRGEERHVWTLVSALIPVEVEAGDRLVEPEGRTAWLLIDEGLATLQVPGQPPSAVHHGETVVRSRLPEGSSVVCDEPGRAFILEDADLAALIAASPGLEPHLGLQSADAGARGRELDSEEDDVSALVDGTDSHRDRASAAESLANEDGETVQLTVGHSLRTVLSRKMIGRGAKRPEETGAAALGSVLKFLGVPHAMSDLDLRLGTQRLPTMLALGRAAEDHGLVARAGTLAEPAELARVPLPLIVALPDRYAVVHALRRGVATVFDPVRGLREIRLRDLRKRWTGRVLLLRQERAFMQVGSEQPSAWQRWRRYAGLLADSSSLLRNVFLVSLAVVAVGLLVPMLNGAIVDQAMARGDGSVLLALAIGIGLVQLTGLAFGSLKAILLAHVNLRLELRLASLLARHGLGIPAANAAGERVGRILASFGEIARIRNALSGEALGALINLLQTLLFGAFLVTYHPGLVAIPALAGVIFFGVARVGGVRYRAIYERLFENSKRRESLTIEQVEGVASLKALNATEPARRRWEEVAVAGTQLERQGIGVRAGMELGAGIVTQTAITGALFVSALLVFGDRMTPGQVLAVSQYVTLAMVPLASLAQYLDSVHQAGVSFRKLDEVFTEELEVDESGTHRELGDGPGRIELRGVRYRYTPDGPWILDGIDLTIPPGEVVAVVGRSGSGKTTLAKLIQGLLRPSEGEITYDGVESRTLHRQSIRALVGMVMQGNSLFSGSIRDNVCYGDDAPDEARLQRVTRLAAAHDFIAELPAGYDTVLAEGGLGLSGGQRQRLSLARCLYMDPKVLILDEATSALDAETEQAIMANMDEILQGRSCIVIAHRLNTVRDADRIVVVDRGRVVESGTHDELMGMGGVYSGLFSHQVLS